MIHSKPTITGIIPHSSPVRDHPDRVDRQHLNHHHYLEAQAPQAPTYQLVLAQHGHRRRPLARLYTIPLLLQAEGHLPDVPPRQDLLQDDAVPDW